MVASNKFKEMKMPKQMKQRKRLIDLDGYKLFEAIDLLSKISEKIGKDCIIESDFDGCNIRAIYNEEETDIEHILRKRSEAATEWKEFKERKAQYEKLKLEFDPQCNTNGENK